MEAKEKVREWKEQWNNGDTKFVPELFELVESLIEKANEVVYGEFAGRTIKDFYCNGFFGRRYDLEGSEIIESGRDYIKIRHSDGYVLTTNFEEGWQLNEMRDLIDVWTGRKSFHYNM